jgi:hypothetical protein
MLIGGLVGLVACSGSSTSPSASHTPDGGGGGDFDSGFAPLAPSPTTWVMKATVPASGEIFKCQYVTMPGGTGWVVGGNSEYTVGSHHLLVYQTDLTTIPAGEDGVGDCYEGTGADYMGHIRGVVYGAQTPTAGYMLPSGIGIPYAQGAVLMIQVHYLNATSSSVEAEADIHLDVTTTGVATNAGTLFFYDPFIDVPAGATATASMRCPIPQSITILGASSHYHARGVGYQAYLDPPAGPPATKPFYTSDNWASPDIAALDMVVPAGSHIRYYCDYDNSQGAQEYIQGPSAATNEMCMFTGLYYPALPLADEECLAGDEVGTGTATCMTTFDCLAACPPVDGGGSGATFIDYSECEQRCVVASCPNTSGPLQAYISCIDDDCQSACAGSTLSNPTSACTSCVAASCASQYEGCQSLTGCQ